MQRLLAIIFGAALAALTLGVAIAGDTVELVSTVRAVSPRRAPIRPTIASLSASSTVEPSLRSPMSM